MSRREARQWRLHHCTCHDAPQPRLCCCQVLHGILSGWGNQPTVGCRNHVHFDIVPLHRHVRIHLLLEADAAFFGKDVSQQPIEVTTATAQSATKAAEGYPRHNRQVELLRVRYLTI